jgi:hypothetical protein
MAASTLRLLPGGRISWTKLTVASVRSSFLFQYEIVVCARCSEWSIVLRMF